MIVGPIRVQVLRGDVVEAKRLLKDLTEGQEGNDM